MYKKITSLYSRIDFLSELILFFYINILLYIDISRYNICMPHVSGKKLKKETLDKIFKKLLRTFEDAHKEHGFSEFFQELFTDTEKKMLAKRLAIIILLNKEIPQHRIVDALGVSSSTVTIMSLHMEQGRYDAILKIANRHKADLLSLIEFILTAGGTLRHKAGRGRWKKIFKDI